MTTRMTAAELQTAREYLGLTTQALAEALNVRHDTIRRWESGRESIPHRVREEITNIDQHTTEAVETLITALQAMPAPTVLVYRTDEDQAQARPEPATAPITHTARWWRHVAARAAHHVPGVTIETG